MGEFVMFDEETQTGRRKVEAIESALTHHAREGWIKGWRWNDDHTAIVIDWVDSPTKVYSQFDVLLGICQALASADHAEKRRRATAGERDPMRPANHLTDCPHCGAEMGWNDEDGLYGQTCGQCGYLFTGTEAYRS